MQSEIERAYESLSEWCRARSFAGHDPFDALNSTLFQATPLRRSRAARLVWTQLFKRSPVNLRTLAGVPPQRNAKGTALFALAALARFRTLRSRETEREARELLDDLLAARLGGTGGAAWGYNFDWQGRAFYAPRGTPTIVPTAFAARALTEAAQAFGDDTYAQAARSACDFILRDLPRRSADSDSAICFSYTPHDRTCVFNASLLAGEVLATVGALTGERELCEWALKAARYVVRRQRADGSWAYGEADFQSWADNFHTAFVLTSLKRIIDSCAANAAAPVSDGDKHEDDAELDGRDERAELTGDELSVALRRGYLFWRESFFLADGWPKYYHDRTYPADTHAAGAAIVGLLELRELDEGALAHAERIALWTLREMRDPSRGFFYYQRRRFSTVRTPYMRWSQAWMMYALARLLEGKSEK